MPSRAMPQARDAELSPESFAEVALSEAFFGPDAGLGGDVLPLESVVDGDAAALLSGGSAPVSPLVELLRTLPDEHTELREALLGAVQQRAQRHVRSAPQIAPSDKYPRERPREPRRVRVQ